MKEIKPSILIGAGLGAVLALGAVWVALRDDESDRWVWAPRGHDVAPVNNESYRAECGGCHFAYQPGLLPAEAWGRIMDSLDNHFGDDATLDPDLTQQLLSYLTANAAGSNLSIRPRAFAASPVPGDPPRITQTAYFKRKHVEVPERLVKDNPKVGSFSHCSACHRSAERGSFNEHRVSIPTPATGRAPG